MKFIKIILQLILMVLCFILGTKYTEFKTTINSATPELVDTIEEEIKEPFGNIETKDTTITNEIQTEQENQDTIIQNQDNTNMPNIPDELNTDINDIINTTTNETINETTETITNTTTTINNTQNINNNTTQEKIPNIPQEITQQKVAPKKVTN